MKKIIENETKIQASAAGFEVAGFRIVFAGWAAYRSYNIERLVERSSAELQETKRFSRSMGFFRN